MRSKCTAALNPARENPPQKEWAPAANYKVCSWWSDENTQPQQISVLTDEYKIDECTL